MKKEDLPKNLLTKFTECKKDIENLKFFSGASPPSIFVSSIKKKIGILLPPFVQDSKIYEFPEEWYKQKFDIDKILELRCRMIYSKLEKNNKNIELLQNVALSKNSLNLSVELKKRPVFIFLTNKYSIPIANPAIVEKISLEDEIKIERKIEYLVNDTDIKAAQAVFEIYKEGIEKSRIERIFSSGSLGLKTERKIVPTRWSITATDSILSNFLYEEIKYLETIDKIRIYKNSYLKNNYWIVLLPEIFSFELIEINVKNKKVWHDYEFVFKRKEYASETGGGYYASKLACLEGLKKIKKQATVVVIREIEELFNIGVWKVREAIKDAFNKNYFEFESLNDFKNYLNNNLKTKDLWLKYSKILKIIAQQRKILT
ncbi:MAG: hypothetical protein RMJ17_00085 [Candidatus Aenigmarchaeota archaeon]|nr:hypothetical protein [Candidatus Aenigmarchaeota archaeon]MDW8148990.1 hypothetical protein [Candidatus Aenigmarchaeota archaeon]